MIKKTPKNFSIKKNAYYSREKVSQMRSKTINAGTSTIFQDNSTITMNEMNLEELKKKKEDLIKINQVLDDEIDREEKNNSSIQKVSLSIFFNNFLRILILNKKRSVL